MSKKILFIKIGSYFCVLLLGIIIWHIIYFVRIEPPEIINSIEDIDISAEITTVPMQERTLFPTINRDLPRINERQLFGEFTQQIGDSIIWLSFSSTEDFGPYTVVMMHGEIERETLRIGFYEVNDEGDVVLHFRFMEPHGEEMVMMPVTQVWSVSINYPFIQLTDGRFTLLTTFYTDENRENLWSNYHTELNKLEVNY